MLILRPIILTGKIGTFRFSNCGAQNDITDHLVSSVRFIVGGVPSIFISKVAAGVLQNQQYNPAGIFISWSWKGI